MPKKYYLSTRKDRSRLAALLEEALKSSGWERTYTWTDLGRVDIAVYAKAALAELEGVRTADVLIVLLPGGFGTHVEIGAALALGKPVILHSPDRETLETPYPCIFHYHPGVRLIVSESLSEREILAALES
jgi:nucleoside 2-deoxyribosyltransferase